MNDHTATNGRLPEPLGQGFDLRDREIDALLWDALSGTAADAGLNDRLFRASVKLLAHEPAAPLRLAGTSRDRRIVRRKIISRLAMAASVALAGAIALKVCVPGMSVSAADAAEVNWDMFASLDTGYGSVSRLFETNAMTLDDVTSEMSMLAGAIEAE